MSYNFQRQFVSIVVPVFNAEETIRDCLISLFNQTYGSFEIIVVDDGSTDATESILKNLSEEVPLQIISINHRGRSSARNIGMKHAKGQIIAFGEADAKYPPDWLLNAMKSMDHVNIAGIVGPRYSWVTNTFISKCIDLELRIRYHNPSFKTSAGWVYKKTVLLEVGGFDESLEIAEDRDLGIRIRERGYKIGFEPSSIMWHMEATNLTELVKKSYSNSRGRLNFYLKYPNEYPSFKVISFFIYILLIPTLAIVSISLLPFLLLFIPILILGQFFRLRAKAKLSKVRCSMKYAISISILSSIRNTSFVVGAISILGRYFWHMGKR